MSNLKTTTPLFLGEGSTEHRVYIYNTPTVPSNSPPLENSTDRHSYDFFKEQEIEFMTMPQRVFQFYKDDAINKSLIKSQKIIMWVNMTIKIYI